MASHDVLSPEQLPEQVRLLIQSLLQVADGKKSLETVRNNMMDTPDVVKLMHQFAGQSIRQKDRVISFGENAQVGDVTVRDIAGGDIYSISVNSVNAPSSASSSIQKEEDAVSNRQTVGSTAIIKRSREFIEKGFDRNLIKQGVEKAFISVSEYTDKIAVYLARPEPMLGYIEKFLADDELRECIHEIIRFNNGERLGGPIVVERSQGTRIARDFVLGIRLIKGYTSPCFVNCSERQEVILNNPSILIVGCVYTREEANLVLNCIQPKQSVLVVVDEIHDDILNVFTSYKQSHSVDMAVIRSPDFGDRRNEIRKDIAILTGGRVLSEGSIANSEDFGSADLVIVEEKYTTLVGCRGSEDAIRTRIAELQNQLTVVSNDFARERLQERLDNLTGGVAVVRVGAATAEEQIERISCAEQAVLALRDAWDDGVIPGGGAALVYAIRLLNQLEAKRTPEGIGASILRAALEAQLTSIAATAGKTVSEFISEIQHLQEKYGTNLIGYDIANGTYTNMFEAGIVEPNLVLKRGLQSDIRAATRLLLTSV